MKKGFTLIELLAVIVILAIIALIATPIVLDIIDDSKKSSVKISADNYAKAVEYYIADSLSNNKQIEDGIYYVNELDIQAKNKPINGWYKIENSQVSDYKLLFENYIVERYDENKIDITTSKSKDIDITEKREMNLVNLDKSEGLKIDYISLSYDKNLKINFYINKDIYNEYTDLKINITNDYYFAYNNANTTKIQNIVLDKAVKKGNYYVFEYDVNSMIFYLFGNFKTKIEGIKNSESVVSSEYNYNLIDYSKEILYSDKITEKNQKVLISLINYGEASQENWPFYLGETNKIKINSVLEEKDINMTNLTSKAQVIASNKPTLDSTITNADDADMLDKFYRVGCQMLIEFPLNFEFYVGNKDKEKATSSNMTLNEFKKYGVLIFEESLFNEIMSNSSDYSSLNYNTKGAIILEAKDENYGGGSSSNYNVFKYIFDLQHLNKSIYFRTFYRNDDGSIVYSKVYSKSIGKALGGSQNATVITLLNFAAEVNESD